MFIAAVALLVVGVLTGIGSGAHARAQARAEPTTEHWVSTWGASPFAPRDGRAARGFYDQSLREIVFASVGGRAVRVWITNRFGSRPLRLARAAVGIFRSEDRVADSRELTFSGRSYVVVPVGRHVLSDPVRLTVRPLTDLAVSMFFSSPTGRPTIHSSAQQVNYVSKGDRVLAPASARFPARIRSWYFLEGVDVLAPPHVLGTVVAMGDSITDGVHSTVGANARWPNDLARELSSLRGPSLGVVDAGIGGNRLLTPSSCFGPSGLARFRSDVLRQAGVREVVLLEGINDIGMSRSSSVCSLPNIRVSARQLIEGYERIIRQAHADGVKIFGATLLPFRGAGYWSPAGEATREAVNRWILHGDAFDGVINFARAVAEPGEPERLDPRYDSGDHLHPNDAGYRAMAAAINLAMLLRAA
jgi:lysophospholipase L1-like esterase